MTPPGERMRCSVAGLLQHFNNRVSEVGHALIMVGIGLQIMAAPPVSNYRALDLLSGFVSAGSIALFFISVGAVRMAALIANGRWPSYGPWLRAIGALVGALIWSQMFLGLIAVPSDNLTSLNAPAYLIFTAIELVSIYRALAMRGGDGRDD
ncbi:hypothetical protein [Nitrobacter sp.]|uniref:hypothetical protein n=1 Tax=Nitrobacter sp. TaxID=29420 RepID=UPI003F652FBC